MRERGDCGNATSRRSEQASGANLLARELGSCPDGAAWNHRIRQTSQDQDAARGSTPRV